MKWLTYKLPEHLVIHYGILLVLITAVMPVFILGKDLNSWHLFNNFIIFDVIYYICFEKFNFTIDE